MQQRAPQKCIINLLISYDFKFMCLRIIFNEINKVYRKIVD